MDELVTLVAQRAGLNQETAEKAVETVIDILKANTAGFNRYAF